MVEQLTCNQLVGGSSPSTGSVAVVGGCAGVGEPGQTVNLVSMTEWVRIQSPPQILFHCLKEGGTCRMVFRSPGLLNEIANNQIRIESKAFYTF